MPKLILILHKYFVLYNCLNHLDFRLNVDSIDTLCIHYSIHFYYTLYATHEKVDIYS